MLKLKNILLLFVFSTLACTVARVFCYLYITDAKTGFFIHRLKSSGILIMAFVAFVLVCVFVFPLFLKLKPVKGDRTSFLSGASALLLGAALMFDMIKGFTAQASNWQFLFKEAFGLLSAAVFILYGLSAFKDINFPKISLCIPTVFLVFQTIEVFTTYSALAVISEHIFDLCLLCTLLVFFLYFGKFNNDLSSKSDNFILSVGLCSSLLCLSSVFSKAVTILFNKKNALHGSFSLSISVLFFGIFIAVWLFESYFKAEHNKYLQNGN